MPLSALCFAMLLLSSLPLQAALPQISLVWPAVDTVLHQGQYQIQVNASDPDGDLARVVFYLNNDSIGMATAAPWSFTYTFEPTDTSHLNFDVLEAHAVDSAGNRKATRRQLLILPEPCLIKIPAERHSLICQGQTQSYQMDALSGTGSVRWERLKPGSSPANPVWIREDSLSFTDAFVGRYEGYYRAVVQYSSGRSCITGTDTLQIWKARARPVFSVAACAARLDSLVLNPSIWLGDPTENFGPEQGIKYNWVISPGLVTEQLPLNNGETVEPGMYYFTDSLVGQHEVILTCLHPESGCESSDTVRVDSLNQKNRLESRYRFEEHNCQAVLIDTLPNLISAILFNPFGIQALTSFEPGSTYNYLPEFDTSGVFPLKYRITDAEMGCFRDFDFLARSSNLQVIVPPVYVNHGLTSYGLAMGSLGVPWKEKAEKYEYEWFKNGDLYQKGQQMNAPDTLGPYYVIAKDSLGCQASDTLTYVFRDMYSTGSIWEKNRTFNSVTLKWDSLTSVHHFIVMKEDSPVSFIPNQGQGFPSNTTFGLADLGNGNYGVYSGTGGHVDVNGLIPNKKYFASAFAWKILAGDTVWDTTHVQKVILKKSPPTSTALEFPMISDTGIRVRLKKKPNFGTLLVARKNLPITGSPIDSISYVGNVNFAGVSDTLPDGSRVIYSGAAEDSVTLSGIVSGHEYFFKSFYFYLENGKPYYGKFGPEQGVKAQIQHPDSISFSPDSVFPSDYIELSGIHLNGVDAVSIGGILCKFIFSGPDRIKVKAPSGYGQKSIGLRRSSNWYFVAKNIQIRNSTSIPIGTHNHSFCHYAGNSITESTPPVGGDPIVPPHTHLGNSFTPRGTLTILVMNLSENTEPAFGNPFSIWPDPGQAPINLDNAFYDHFTDFEDFDEDAADFTLSNFYYQMSKNSEFGDFRVRFLVLPYTTANSETAIRSGLENYFTQNPAQLGLIDTRSNSPFYIRDNSNFSPDKVVDYVIQLRRTDGPGGIAGIPSINFVVNGITYRIANGCQITGARGFRWDRLKGIITHEISHNVYDAPHVFFNNDVTGNHYTTTTGWGTMVLNGNAGLGFNCLSNPWESWILGWKRSLSISQQDQQGTYYLKDFVESGGQNEILSITLPNTLPPQRLWISNHAGTSHFEGGENLLSSAGGPYQADKGVYLMVEDMEIQTLRQRFQITNRQAGGLKTLHSAGGWDIMAKDYPNIPFEGDNSNVWRWFADIRLMRANPFSLYNQNTLLRLKSPYRTNPNRFNFDPSGAFAAPSYIANEVVFPRFKESQPNPGMELRQHAFGRSSEIEILGINSPVPIFNHQTFNRIGQDFDPIILNGIEVQIHPLNAGDPPNMARQIDVRFDRNRFTGNRLLTGFFHVTNLPDLQPDIIIGSSASVHLDKPQNPNRTHKDAVSSSGTIIQSDLYPDFITPSRFICKAGSVLELEEDATFIVENESGLVIESGATVILGENARIVVKPACTFIVHAGATITAATGATIEVGDNSYYCLESLAGLSATQVLLGHRLGAVSPKLAPYLNAPANCGTPLQNFKLAFACDGGAQSIDILNYTETVDVKLGNTTVLSDVATIPLAGLADGHYTVLPRSTLAGAHGSYASTFDVYGQTADVSWTSGERSLSNILVLNHNLSISGGTTTLEPGTQVYIKGTPVYGETMFSNSVTGGDISLSGTAKMEVRTGSRFQGMCGNMWGGLSISGDGFLAAYNNMRFEDSFDGIQANSGANGSGGDAQRMNFHIFNARFANNLNGIKSAEAIDAFNFIRNSTFTSSIAGMKAPFEKPSQGSCIRQISRNHVTFDQSWVKVGNFWNNTLEFALNGLTVVNNKRGFNSVSNSYRNHYGPAISLGEGFSSLLDRENIVVPKDDIFCAPANTLPNPYISLEIPYAKFGIYANNEEANFTLQNSVVIGESGFDATAKGVGVYLNGANGVTLTANTFSRLNVATLLAGTEENTGNVAITQNTFSDNETALRFESSYQANHALTLKCNTFNTPTNPAPFSNRYGMWVESGAEMPDIGGLGATVEQQKPAANWWPVAGTTNSSLSPWPVTALSGGGGVEHWYSPSGWETVHNLTEDVWSYFRYKNEFFGTFQDMSISQGFEIPEVNRMVRSRSDQVILSGELYDNACSNFGQVLVFPTRPAVSQDSTLTQKSGSFSGSSDFLDQNIPNPASNSTTIGYRLPSDAKAAKLELFELSTGRIVKSVGIPVSGHGQVELGLHGIPGGVYGYRLIAGDRPLGWKKMIVVR